MSEGRDETSWKWSVEDETRERGREPTQRPEDDTINSTTLKFLTARRALYILAQAGHQHGEMERKTKTIDWLIPVM